MPSEIQQNRYDRLIRRVAGIIGPGSKVSEVLTELFPVLDVESVPAELLILAGTNTSFGGGTILGVAGQSARMGVFNPAGSNTICTLTDVYVTSNASGETVRWGLSITELATQTAVELFTDTRNALVQRPVGRIGQESSVALAPATGQIRTLANTPFHLEGKNEICTLRPGIGFQIGLTTNALRINCAFYWRERPMESSEVLNSG